MATGLETALVVVARVLFGGVLAVMGLNHFLETEQMSGYADHKGVPFPTLSVLASGAVLVLGGLGVVAGVLPVVSAVAVAGFLLVSALLMHDFWAATENREDELTQFLKNVALAGGALALAAVGLAGQALAAGVSLF